MRSCAFDGGVIFFEPSPLGADDLHPVRCIGCDPILRDRELQRAMQRRQNLPNLGRLLQPLA